MKKQFILLPLVSAVLAACSSNNPAPVVNASGNPELSPGIMQPVDTNMGAINSSGGWQSDIQSAPMPSSMNTTPVQTMPQPVSVPQPVATVPQPITNPVITEQPPQPTTTTKIVKKRKRSRKKWIKTLRSHVMPTMHQCITKFKKGSTMALPIPCVKATQCS